jgi:peptidoglycan-N-acetylglucosamine deacetylase
VSADDRRSSPSTNLPWRRTGSITVVMVAVIACAALVGSALSQTGAEDGESVASADITSVGATGTTSGSATEVTATAPPTTVSSPTTVSTTEAPTTTAPAPPAPPVPIVTVPPAIGAGPFWPGPWQVALTFDDGPDPTWTPAILEQLARYGVPATFFVLGSAVERWPDMVAQMAAGGHRVQNHSWTHPYLTALGNDGVLGQLSGTADVIQSIVGYRPACWRPPYGSFDGRVDAMAASLGFSRVMWNTAPNDYQQPPPADMVANVVGRAGELGGAGMVVVLHDGGGNRANTAAALPGMIEGLGAAGYSFVALC